VYTGLNNSKTAFTLRAEPAPREKNMLMHVNCIKENNSNDIECTERTQRQATKLVCSLRHLCYDKHLKKSGLATLQTRRLRGDLIKAYKILIHKEHMLMLVTSSSLQILVTTFEDTA